MLRPVAVLALAAACGSGEKSAPAGPPRRACPAGSVVVHVDEEAAALAGCRRIAGELVVGPSFAMSSLAALGSLEEVTGSFEVSSNAALAGLYLGGLRRVGGSVTVDSNLSAETVSLHHLVEVGGDLVVRENRSLLRLDLGALRRVGGRLEVTDHPLLDSVSVDALASAGEVAIDGNPAWSAEEIAALRSRLGK